ncbi:MAG: S-layer homology domain-containing protein, partial [Clostridiales bacterium]|nr:S-layer homology domain-containing protein [Clostridiales bacterium]
MKKKFLSVVLALAMVLSLMPAAFAAEGGVSTAEELKTAIENAPKDGSQVTITLDADISDMSTDQIVTIAEGQNILLDMAEHSIKVASAFAGRPIRNEGTLTVTGNGTIDSSNSNTGGYGAIDNYGTLTIENGTFTGSVNASGASIKNRPDGDLTIKDGTFNGAVTAVYNAGIAKIYNGLFDCRSCSACNNSSWGYTIQSHMDEEGKSPQLYFYNGTVIGVQGGFSTSAGYSEIHDGSFKTVSCATHTNGSSAHYALYIAGEDEDVKCVVYGGSFESVSKTAALIGNDNTGGDGGINANATTEIKGGTFKAPAGQKAVTGAENTGNPVITGGKFSSDVSEYLADDCVQNANGEVGKLEQVAVAEVVAADGSTTTKYASLTGAVNAAKDGETVTLLKDVDLGSGYVNIAKKLTLDLNGYTVTGSNTWVIGVYSDVTINDSSNGQGKIINSSTSSGTRIAVLAQENSQDEKTCKLTIEGGIITATGIENSYGVFSNNSTTTYGPTIIVNGGEITGYFAGLTVTHDTDLTISGGEITGNYYAVSGNGSADDTDITINGGKLVSKDGNVIYHPQVGNMTIGGNAELTGPNGVQYCGAGMLTIQDNVVITATGSYTEFPTKPSEQGDGSTDDGAALSIVSRGDGYQDGDQKMAVNITGGTLNSVNNAAISVYRLQNKNGWVTNDQTNLSSYLAALNITGGKLSGGERKGALEIDTAAEKQVAVSGGLFSSDPSAYCVDGKTGVTNSDNATKADYPYAVGEEVADAKPAVVESATVPANTPDNASQDAKDVADQMTGGAGVKQDAALEGAIKDAANGNKIEGNTELATGKTVTATLNEATNGSANDNDVAIVYQPYVDVTVTDAVKSGATVTSFTADLTPMYRVVATTNAVVSGGTEIKVSGEVDADANAVLIESGKELNGLADRQYEVKLALPNDFANAGDKLCIKHDKNGSAEYYTGTVSEDGGKLFVTFISNGFSPFTVYAASETAASIGDNVYPTLQAAVDAVENNGTIKLLKDGETATVSRTVKFTVDPSGKNYTISLGGNCTDKDAGEHIFDVVYTAPSSGGGSSSATYTVNVEKSKHGSVESNRSRASSGTTVTLTVQPDKGYELDELTVTDKDGDELKLTRKSDTKYTFTMPRSAVTVEAVFVEEREDTGYSDVSADAWYADAVQYVTDKGMMQGNNGKFMPADKLNRGQMA